MSKIEELQEKIVSIESQASELDTKAVDYYEQLYKLLSVAYFAAKDIIQLQAPDVPLTVDKALEAKLSDANNTIQSQQIEIDELQANYSTLENKLKEVRDILG